MKLSLLLLAVCCASLKGAKSTTQRTRTNEELLERAASQLARLSVFRRTREPPETNEYRRVAAEPPPPPPPPPQQQQTEDILEAQKRIDELRATATQLLRDPRYQAMMQDRIKRSFIGGIANKLVGGVVGAASGASRGIAGLSSSNTPSEYGHYGHSYQSKFDIGDFAKAIINTLVQAIKAIGGGAIAGGGALVKGGGYLVSAKGQIISSAGNAITSLGKSIASSAIIASPKPVYGHPGYSYNHPSPHGNSGHDLTYDGPPPSADAYAGPQDAYNAGHSSYASPSNDDGEDDHAGLLVVKETKPEHDEGHDDHPPTSPGHSSGPSLAALEESFGGPPKGPSGDTITKITGFLNSGAPTISGDDEHREEHVDYYPEHKDQQPPPSGHQSSHSGYESASPPGHNQDNNNYQIYDSYGTKVPPYSQLPDAADHDAHQASQDYQSPAYQRIPESLTTHLELPKLQAPSLFKDLASFADYHHHGNAQQSEPLKIPIFGSHQNSLDNAHDVQGAGSFGDYGLPNYGTANAPMQHSSIGLEIGGGSQLLNSGYENYQLHNAMGFDRHVQHPAPLVGASPAILGLWRRFSDRRSGSSPYKRPRISKGVDIQRSVGYSLMNAKLTRI